MGFIINPNDSHSAVISFPMNSFALSPISILGYLPCRCIHWFNILLMCVFVFEREFVGIEMQYLLAVSTIVNSVLLLFPETSWGPTVCTDRTSPG